MFKNLMIILVSLFLVQMAYAQELRELQWEEVPTRVIPDLHEYSDKGLWIVHTTIPNPKFESNRGILPGVKEYEPGVWWVKVKLGVQLLSISADGYQSLVEINTILLSLMPGQ